MDEKHRLERAACEDFLKAYNRENDTSFAIKEHMDKPDFLITNDSGKEIGVEVTHLFDDGEEAKTVLGRGKTDKFHGIIREDIYHVLSTGIKNKTKQAAQYTFPGRLFLVIRIGSPIHEMADFRRFQEDIDVPETHPFEKIWLLCRNPNSHLFTDLAELSN